ncbi:Retrotransposon gag protein [Phytophthora infestans]|uniref:Retrotransposon gag protein n=1 Tax=Phytophthora infestans TaxID=4787 RepID=A0A833SNC6_PHYIN|nr:Retrotransposon gag protein [Phytophthora infestans]
MSDVGSEFDVAKDTRPLDAERDRSTLAGPVKSRSARTNTHADTRSNKSGPVTGGSATRTEQRARARTWSRLRANQALKPGISRGNRVMEEIQATDLARKRNDDYEMANETTQSANHGYRNGEELYVEWDVVSLPNAPSFTNLELESRVSMGLKQKETPVYGGTEDDDIDVYVLNMISWYAAYGLYLRTAKKWLLQDYKGERRWSHIVRKKMKQRFVTRPREEDLVVSFFDCNQGSNFLDTYIDEFQRLSRSNDVSEKYKMIKFKKGLRSNQLRELVKTQIHESLDELFDAARSFNPRDVPAEKPTGSQNPYPGSNKKAGAFKNKSSELDGVSRPNIDSTNAQNRVFDPGTKANYMYFESGNGEKKLTPERYLIKTVRCEKDTTSAAARTFFDEGADFCGISEEFVEQQGWMKGLSIMAQCK